MLSLTIVVLLTSELSLIDDKDDAVVCLYTVLSYTTLRDTTSLRRSVLDLTRHYDEIVVDVGAGDGVGMESILRIADLAVVPLQPNELDIWTAGLLDELAGDAIAVNEKLAVKAVLNRAPTHHANTDAQAAHAALMRCQYIETTGLTIRERSSIRRSVPAGKLVNEWQPRDSKGEQELGALYNLVYGAAIPGEMFGGVTV